MPDAKRKALEQKKKYPEWKFPNKGFEAKPPETIIKIQDQ